MCKKNVRCLKIKMVPCNLCRERDTYLITLPDKSVWMVTLQLFRDCFSSYFTYEKYEVEKDWEPGPCVTQLSGVLKI